MSVREASFGFCRHLLTRKKFSQFRRDFILGCKAMVKSVAPRVSLNFKGHNSSRMNRKWKNLVMKSSFPWEIHTF